ncbi:TorD/DmsD family molecular chaperone [Raoultibacter phocaeensis]|uniref:TorD/DmsD family molecular chaperone n=1 Tax=Raoultibacter phocaeensis TaxID=2479841 RepID=UPI00111A0126|nr:molecular chaperone TorD family protein [Raoultibacter phocaeensis]
MQSQPTPEHVDAWQARAALCELAAFSFRYPGKELAEALDSGEWADAACEISQTLGLSLPEGFAEQLRSETSENEACASGSESEGDRSLHALRAEATRLFIGSPEPVVSPYEGVWAALDDGVQPLLFVNPKSMEVERFCRACGLGRPEGTNEPLDHIGTEFELLQYLALLSAGIALPAPDGPRAEDFPGGSPEAAYEAFVSEHARFWMPRFADKVIAETRLPFYRSAAELLNAFFA